MMKRILLAAFVALSLGGCAGTKVGDLIAVATTTITNPVDKVDIYRVKNAYAASLELVVEYRKFCYARSYKSLMADPVAKPICQKRRAVLLTVQAQRPRVASAIVKAEEFVRDYPTLNAATAISAAWQAVKDFQAVVPRAAQ